MQDILVGGNSGKDVLALKLALRKQLGVDAAGFTGLTMGDVFDADTEAAARRWQSEWAWWQTGCWAPTARQCWDYASLVHWRKV